MSMEIAMPSPIQVCTSEIFELEITEFALDVRVEEEEGDLPPEDPPSPRGHGPPGPSQCCQAPQLNRESSTMTRSTNHIAGIVGQVLSRPQPFAGKRQISVVPIVPTVSADMQIGALVRLSEQLVRSRILVGSRVIARFWSAIGLSRTAAKSGVACGPLFLRLAFS